MQESRKANLDCLIEIMDPFWNDVGMFHSWIWHWFSFIGEESVSDGGNSKLTSTPTWIVDPVDGTTNFVHMYVSLFINTSIISFLCSVRNYQKFGLRKIFWYLLSLNVTVNFSWLRQFPKVSKTIFSKKYSFLIDRVLKSRKNSSLQLFIILIVILIVIFIFHVMLTSMS